MSKSMIIIGSGVSGLSAGIYSQINGFNTKIYEMQNVAGGLCATWKRKDYLIEGGLAWLLIGKDNSFAKMWSEIGVLNKIKSTYINELSTIKLKSGKEITFYSDVNKLEEELLSNFPEDSNQINEFIKDILKLSKFNNTFEVSKLTKSLNEKISSTKYLLPYLSTYKKLGEITIGDFANKFKNKDLKEIFKIIMTDESLPLIILVNQLAMLNTKAVSFPKRGSSSLIKAMVDEYLLRKGEINYNSNVEKIIVKDNKAIGIKLQSGEEYYADIVISSCDYYTTMVKLLEARYETNKVNDFLENITVNFCVVQITLGISKMIKTSHYHTIIPTTNELIVNGKVKEYLGIKNYSYDSSFAPKDKTIIQCKFNSEYSYWKEIIKDKDAYEKEKQRIVENVIENLKIMYPEIEGNIEVIDITTPLTYEKYANAYEGGCRGLNRNNKIYGRILSLNINKLSNFYRIGQWIRPLSGVTLSILTGRDVIELICKENKIKFINSDGGLK